ncbi:MAG TPA: DUF6160 family protein [Candidatus Macondimonas sp.]|nr:DUF6160 family protein [Candidatus Macondimonas sp.]
MKLKSLSVLGLLAAAPMASQAAMVEMNETELSDVSGQASISGLLFNYSADFNWNPAYSAPSRDVNYSDISGGVQRETKITSSLGFTPTLNLGIAGNFTGNDYVVVEDSLPISVYNIDFTRTRSHYLFNPQR